MPLFDIKGYQVSFTVEYYWDFSEQFEFA
jgi:hypothetical protein